MAIAIVSGYDNPAAGIGSTSANPSTVVYNAVTAGLGTIPVDGYVFIMATVNAASGNPTVTGVAFGNTNLYGTGTAGTADLLRRVNTSTGTSAEVWWAKMHTTGGTPGDITVSTSGSDCGASVIAMTGVEASLAGAVDNGTFYNNGGTASLMRGSVATTRNGSYVLMACADWNAHGDWTTNIAAGTSIVWEQDIAPAGTIMSHHGTRTTSAVTSSGTTQWMGVIASTGQTAQSWNMAIAEIRPVDTGSTAWNYHVIQG